MLAGAVLLPATARAQQYPGPDETPKITPGDASTPEAGTPAVASHGGEQLAVTGGQIAGLALVGLAAATVGLRLLRAGRRTARASIDLS